MTQRANNKDLILVDISPDTNRLFYAAPTYVKKNTRRLALTFNGLLAYAEKMNEEKYLGFKDWRVPSGSELYVMIKNKNKPGLKGVFDKANINRLTASYWSTTVTKILPERALSMKPKNNDRRWDFKDLKLSGWLVRG